ncbi:hypothetical protein FACS1894214_1910 [Planctomycetales bacterium]|nr:hypothetical protein FACS1894214_1910 [Planctomycetales bacterium]
MRRVKSLWNINQYQAGGFGYKFSRHANAAMEKFYPGIAVPYLKDINPIPPDDTDPLPPLPFKVYSTSWYEPKGFQLVHPGLDEKFGAWSELGGAYGSCTIQGTGTPPDATSVSRIVVLSGKYAGSGVTQYDEDNIIYNGDLTTVKEALP